MKISISSRISEYSNDKTKSFINIEDFVNLAIKNNFNGVSLRPAMVSTESTENKINKTSKIFRDNKIRVSMITSNIHLAKNGSVNFSPYLGT